MEDRDSVLGTGEAGPEQSAALFQSVYERLRALARSHMRRERADHTLQPTALVHEAFLRMMGGPGASGRTWEDRSQFYAAAAEAMRRILVDAARRRRRLKRGGSFKRVELGDVDVGSELPAGNLLELDDALDALAERHPEKTQLVKLRYFAGLTIEEASEVLGISYARAKRHWVFARAWLYRRLEGAHASPARAD